MSLATVTKAPPIYTAAGIGSIIAADLGERGIPCVVEIGTWDPARSRGEARVSIMFGKFAITSPTGAYQPGPAVATDYAAARVMTPTPGTDVARPMLDDVQTYRLWIHAPAAPGVDSGAERAQQATMRLKRDVLAAIRRFLAAPFRFDPSGDWPSDGDLKKLGFTNYTYGSLCYVDVPISTPILDDPLAVIAAESLTTTARAVFPDGGDTAAERDTV